MHSFIQKTDAKVRPIKMADLAAQMQRARPAPTTSAAYIASNGVPAPLPPTARPPDVAAIFLARCAHGEATNPCLTADFSSSLPGSWLAAWDLGQHLATAERSALAMAVAVDMVASHLLPTARQLCRSKRRGRSGTSSCRLAQPRMRKLWQHERARRPTRGVLLSPIVRPRHSSRLPLLSPAATADERTDQADDCASIPAVLSRTSAQ